MTTEPDAPTRVLLVHADPLLRASFARLLRAAGFHVTEAATRDDADRELHARRTDAVAFDYETVDGPSLLKLAREKYGLVRRVVFADVPRPGEAWLERPVDYEELVAALRAR